MKFYDIVFSALCVGIILVGAVAVAGVSANPSPTTTATIRVAAGHDKIIGTLDLVNTPVYGGVVDFHVHLYKKTQLVNSAIFCRQTNGDVFMQERWLSSANWSRNEWDGEVTLGPLSSEWWDAGQSATCIAVVFQDVRNGNESPIALTPWVEFAVLP